MPREWTDWAPPDQQVCAHGTPLIIDAFALVAFGKAITEAEPGMALETLRNSAFSAFLVGQHAARLMRENKPNANGAKGTIIVTNTSAALRGFPSSGAFAMACHAKSGLAQSMARELMPQGIHVANVPIDAAVGWTQEDGTRAHRRAGTTVGDNMADPDRIAETYLQLHQQHRSTWAFEVVLRPWGREMVRRASGLIGLCQIGKDILQTRMLRGISRRADACCRSRLTVFFRRGLISTLAKI